MGSSISKESNKTNIPSERNENENGDEDLLASIFFNILSFTVAITPVILTVMMGKEMINMFNNINMDSKILKRRLSKNGRKKNIFINYHESLILNDLIDPDTININFSDIGGLKNQKQDIYDIIILPLKHPELFNHVNKNMLAPTPKGVLLYGLPGTGKSMLAKAIAKECDAFFLDLKLSTLSSKYHGESNKMIRATFSLANKLNPCIIFIDEVDAFMGKRQSNIDSSIAIGMKTEFMALWDGLSTSNESNGFGVVIIGATNRPNDVDSAFLRRMPRTFETNLPNAEEREDILSLILHDINNETNDNDIDIKKIAKMTQFYSGSDLKELCRAACTIPIREFVKRKDKSNINEKARSLKMKDFEEAKEKVLPTGVAAKAYEDKNQNNFDSMNKDILKAIISSIGLQSNRLK